MPEISGKIKKYSKKVAIFCSLFLAVFLAGFYIVNLDLSLSQKSSSEIKSGANVNLNEEFSQRLGSTTFSLGSYESWLKRFDVYPKNSGLDLDLDKDGLPNYLEYVYGTNPLKVDSDGDGFSDKQEIINGYDPDAPGEARPMVEITISKINVSAPMVWSKNENEKDMLADLENGVNHFAKTAAPGQIGNMIISGHSSNYIWAKGNYNHIFKDLNNLEVGDIVTVDTIQKNGRNITYRYKVNEKFITSADDEKIFAATTDPSLTLSTCWPIGTNLRRIIAKANLAQ